MKTHLIQFRLSLSYAAIALLTALLLGGILLGTLYQYYTGLEMDYLTENAVAIGNLLSGVPSEAYPAEALEALLKNFGFLSNIQIRLLDANEQELLNTGLPEVIRAVAVGAPGDILLSSFTPLDAGQAAGFGQGELIFGGAYPAPQAPLTGTFFTISSGSVSSFPGFSVMIADPTAAAQPVETSLEEMERSNQKVQLPYFGLDGELAGYVELSNSPAYGRRILGSVAWGWGIAGISAVALAALAGWLVSQRFSQPLQRLTEITAQMAQGDLGVRAQIDRQDEFGALGRSFNQMADNIEAKVGALRRFVADAAHELFTPLTALRTNLELALDEKTAKHSQAHLHGALEQVERMGGLTRGLLALSRLEASDPAAALETLDWRALIQSSAEIYASQAEQKQISFHLALPETPVLVQGDPTLLQMAVQNLLENALKFTPAGGEVRASLETDAASSTLSITDNGIGVPDEDLPLLFNRFHRGRNAAAYPGSGLGLALVKSIVERHNGEISAVRLAQGTRFEFRLPQPG